MPAPREPRVSPFFRHLATMAPDVHGRWCVSHCEIEPSPLLLDGAAPQQAQKVHLNE